MIISLLIVVEWSVLDQLCQRNLIQSLSSLDITSSPTKTFQTKLYLIWYLSCPIVNIWKDQIFISRFGWFEVGGEKKRNLRKDEKNQSSPPTSNISPEMRNYGFRWDLSRLIWMERYVLGLCNHIGCFGLIGRELQLVESKADSKNDTQIIKWLLNI